MKPAEIMRLLEGELGYYVHDQRGSHKKLRSSQGYPQLIFAFHNGIEIPSGLVRKILTKDVGLSVEEAARLLGIG